MTSPPSTAWSTSCAKRTSARAGSSPCSRMSCAIRWPRSERTCTCSSTSRRATAGRPRHQGHRPADRSPGRDGGRSARRHAHHPEQNPTPPGAHRRQCARARDARGQPLSPRAGRGHVQRTAGGRTALRRRRQRPDRAGGDEPADQRGEVHACGRDSPVSVGPSEGRWAVLTVTDSGTGIEPALLPHLFQPFMQGDRSLERTAGGLGLGLTLVKGLVELHGGDVTVSSGGRGQGAEFVVRLPLAESASRQEGAAPGTRRPDEETRPGDRRRHRDRRGAAGRPAE